MLLDGSLVASRWTASAYPTIRQRRLIGEVGALSHVTIAVSLVDTR